MSATTATSELSLDSLMYALSTDPVVAAGLFMLLGGWCFLGLLCYACVRNGFVGLTRYALALWCGPIAWILETFDLLKRARRAILGKYGLENYSCCGGCRGHGHW